MGIAPNTAKRWISVLQASQQIFLLEPYHRQRAKRLDDLIGFFEHVASE